MIGTDIEARIKRLEQLLANGRDDQLLRFSLGSDCLQEGRFDEAIEHLSKAVFHNQNYSAAYKLLGKAHTGNGDIASAEVAYKEGIESAERAGDKQAAKEMRVFLKRLEKESNQK